MTKFNEYDKMRTKERWSEIMDKESNEYSKEFKLAAIFLMKSKRFKPKEVFEMLGGIDRQTVYRWIKEYDESEASAFDNGGTVSPQELRRLQKENADLKMDNEILKKATAYFAKTNKNG